MILWVAGWWSGPVPQCAQRRTTRAAAAQAVLARREKAAMTRPSLVRAISSVGRAPRLHRGCRRFEPVIAHHEPSFRSRVGASDPSSRERTFHACQTRWFVPVRRGSLFGEQPYAGSVSALLLFDLPQAAEIGRAHV